jgi:hypothetical protein
MGPALSTQGVDEFGVDFFTEFGQVKAFALVPGIVFHTEINSAGIGLQVLMTQPVAIIKAMVLSSTTWGRA